MTQIRGKPETALGLIQERIAQGRALQNESMRDSDHLSEVWKREQTWEESTAAILKQLFVESSFLEQFTAYLFYGTTTDATLAQDIGAFQSYIGERIRRLESILEQLEVERRITDESINLDNNNSLSEKTVVFLIHGHDDKSRLSVENFLRRVGINVVVLKDKPNMGKTLIEKFEAYSNVDYAIAIATPDDVGRRDEDSTPEQRRARQNVIFELGYFIGKLGRGKVCLFYKPDLELPSDLAGVVYTSLDGAWETELTREFREARVVFDESAL